ncbi:MAG: hypothetical protein ABSG43_08535 [Solirubrobacteraceae bacterium]|jgi:hypothetical protein
MLGLIWLLDGALQFQSFMYGKGFVQMLTGQASGQPGWVASSVNWGATTLQSHQALFNTLAALIQVAIGAGILCRRTAKTALLVSFVWALVVWWFGEAFGMLFMNMAMPLTGAPGAVVLYALIGLIVWPNDRPGGLLGVRGARTAWAALWLVMAWLWLLAPSSSANAVRNAIIAAPAGIGWLSALQNNFAIAAKGNGLVIAFAIAAASAAIAVAVAANWRAKEFLALAVFLNLLYWVIGQGFGGIFAGGATDPNAGLLFIVLAYVMYTLIPFEASQRNSATNIAGPGSPALDFEPQEMTTDV